MRFQGFKIFRISTLSPAVLGGVLSVVVSGCGHPASAAECELILDKVVEIELAEQKVTDPATIELRKQETRKIKGPELLTKCLGRKVTNAAMACVRTAKTYEHIESVCLR